MRRRTVVVAVLAGGLAMALAGNGMAGSERPAAFVFDGIDGGAIDLAAYRGGPVLVVNTASRCGFTGQFDGLQALWDQYRDRGLTVLGVPSNSFRQELGSAAEVADFCEVNFGIDFPMTDLVEVTGPEAHPFYAWAAAQGVRPSWNFHKILLDGEGRIVADYGARIGPSAPGLIAAIEALLPKG
jgi:glutathione peroxidase